jgi:hypothetical protein
MGVIIKAYQILAGNLKSKTTREDPGVDGRRILKCFLGEIVVGVDWIHLAQVR